ncbi:MAG: hypothetical protein ACTSSO_04740 [Candidatus Hodarchaeales archaeon]
MSVTTCFAQNVELNKGLKMIRLAQNLLINLHKIIDNNLLLIINLLDVVAV